MAFLTELESEPGLPAREHADTAESKVRSRSTLKESRFRANRSAITS